MWNYWFHSLWHPALYFCLWVSISSSNLLFLFFISHIPISLFHYLILSSNLSSSCFSLLCLSPYSSVTQAWQCFANKHKCNQRKRFSLPSFKWLHFSIKLNRHESLSCLGYEEIERQCGSEDKIISFKTISGLFAWLQDEYNWGCY